MAVTSVAAKDDTEWPDNQFTKGVPKPTTGTILYCDEYDTSTIITMQDWTLEDAKAYAKKVRAAGFTKRWDEIDLPDGGYKFFAHNDKDIGVAINIDIGEKRKRGKIQMTKVEYK